MVAHLSIVMPVLNRVGFVRRAIDSVVNQQIAGIEILVVDGGSTDGTQEVSASMPNVRVLDAPKSSIYEALNIGIKAAQAPIIGHLNSDDRIPPGALNAVLSAAAADPSAAMVRGRAAFVALRSDGTMLPLPEYTNNVSRRLSIGAVTFGVPALNCCFVRAETYRALGLYDESLRIAADREWILRAVLAQAPIRHIDEVVYEYLIHQASLTLHASKAEAEYAREHLRIAERYIARLSDAENLYILREWHAQEMVRLLLRGKLTDGLGQEICHAFRTSPSWPIRSVAPVMRVMIRRLKSRGRFE